MTSAEVAVRPKTIDGESVQPRRVSLAPYLWFLALLGVFGLWGWWQAVTG